MGQWWWEPRREGERTSVFLARVLNELGPEFAQIANHAEANHYDDFFCPPEVDDGMNMHRLLRDMLAVIQVLDDKELKNRAMNVAQAAKDGQFDGTTGEAQEWGQSPDGQAAFNELVRRKK